MPKVVPHLSSNVIVHQGMSGAGVSLKQQVVSVSRSIGALTYHFSAALSVPAMKKPNKNYYEVAIVVCHSCTVAPIPLPTYPF